VSRIPISLESDISFAEPISEPLPDDTSTTEAEIEGANDLDEMN
jgi:hypothetical protein